jgi:hypothetical protein
VRLLRDICARLPAADAVQALLAGLGGSGSGAISSFELLSSGAVKALRDYLQGVDLAGVPDRQERLLQRMSEFAGGWLPSVAQSGWHLAAGRLASLHACGCFFSMQLLP